MEFGGRRQERVRGRLAAQPALLRDQAVHPHVEQVGQPGGIKDLLGVGTGRHDRRRYPFFSYRTDVGDGSVVDLNAPLGQLRQHEVVLAVAKAVDRGRARRVIRLALGQLDAAGLQEGPGAVLPGLAVHVGVVLVVRVERDELGSGALGAGAEEFVEHLLPRRRVHHRRLGDHAVHIEQAGLNPVGKPEHRPSAHASYAGKSGLSSGTSRSALASSSMLTSLKVTTRTFFTNLAGRYMSHTQASRIVTSKNTSPLSLDRTFSSTSFVR